MRESLNRCTRKVRAPADELPVLTEAIVGHPDVLDRIDVLDRDIAEVRQHQCELAREQRLLNRGRDQGLDLGM